MIADGTTVIFITFLLAILGYVGLTSVVLLSLRGAVPAVLWRIIASIITLHVLMVWAFRYQWHFDLSVRNGYAGFIMFHGALLMILLSLIVHERISRTLIRLAFGIVSLGAIGATFLYDVVAIYRVPVILCAVAGGVGLIWTFITQRRRASSTV